MKCYSNSDNPGALKILIASKCRQLSVNLELVNAKDYKACSITKLPFLVIDGDNEKKIFSTTAAARYLFEPSQSNCDKVDIWLDWETSVLQPALASSNFDKFGDSVVIDLLDYVNKSLENKSYLVDDEFTVADVTLWSSLFALLTEPIIVTQYLSSKSSILQWFNKINALEPVQLSVKSWSDKQGSTVFKSFLATAWYPGTGSAESKLDTEESTPAITDSDLKQVEISWLKEPRVKPKRHSLPVLPLRGEKNILITSALPYVNNVPHLGNIIGCVLSADVFARYCRLRNWNTLYVGGTDEYGTATETKAIEEKLTPQQICDKYFKIHREIYSWFNIGFDHFGRTTTEQQKIIAQDIFLRLHQKGYTSTASVEQLYCESCKRFLADRFVEGTCPKCKYEDARGDQCDGCGHLINAVELIQPRCKLCGKMPVIKNSDQLFLELPKIEPVLREWFHQTSANWSHNARVITNSWLKDGLKARCITRDLKWGVPVPLHGFESKVFYVWFDAPIGYISITASYTKEWRKWWQPSPDTPVTLYQFMAKDNVPFHSVMFPATLLAIDEEYILVNNIMATEYLNYEDGKFSKSRGVGVFGTDAKDTGIPADIFRFYLLYVRPESQDSSFSWADLAAKLNTELLNNIGNFVNRALMFDEKFFNSEIPSMNLMADDYNFLALVTQELKAYNYVLEKGKLRDGIKYMLNISRHGNQYIQSNQPWVLVKGSPADKARAGTIIGISCNIACLLATIIEPYMPNTSVVMNKQMNIPSDAFILTDEVKMFLKPGHKIGKPAPLFAKIELGTIDALKKKFSGKQRSASPPKVMQSKQFFYNLQATSRNIETLKKLEAAVAEQGELVRKMKSSGTDKAEWMPHVNVLLDMKKQLTEMQKAFENIKLNEASSQNGDFSDKEVEIRALEEAITEQGDKIRALKSKKEPKEVWGPLVTELLELKSKLAKLKPSVDPGTGGKKKKN